MICPNCGGYNMDTDKKCFNCKEPLPVQTKEREKKEDQQLPEYTPLEFVPADASNQVRAKPIYTYWWFLLTAIAVIVALALGVLFFISKNRGDDIDIPDIVIPTSTVSQLDSPDESEDDAESVAATRTVTFPDYFLDVFGDFRTGLNIADNADAEGNHIRMMEDGTISVTMTEQKGRELLETIGSAIDANIDAIMNSETAPNLFLSFERDPACTVLTVSISGKKASYEQRKAIWNVEVQSLFYQMFNGTPDGTIRVVLVDENNEIISFEDHRLDDLKSPPEPEVIPPTYNETFEYDGFLIMLSDNVQWTTITNESHPHYGKTILAVPIAVKNTTAEPRALNLEKYRQYLPSGGIMTRLDSGMEYDINDAAEIAPGEQTVSYMFFIYEKDGEYRVEFDGPDAASSIEVILPVEKPQNLGF